MPRVGSSSAITAGRAARIAARATRSRWPTDRSSGWRSATAQRSISSRALGHPRPALGGGERQAPQGEGHLVVNALGEQVAARVLAHEAERGEAPLGGHSRHLAPLQHDAAALRGVEPGEHAHQRALAAAVGAAERDDLARAQLQRRPAQHRAARVACVDALERGDDDPGGGRLGRRAGALVRVGVLQPAFAHGQDAVGRRACAVGAVLAQHHRDARGRQVGQGGHQRGRRGVVELGGRLVEQHHPGAGREDGRQGHALALAAGEGADGPAAQAERAGRREGRLHPAGDVAGGDPGALQPEGHVALHRAEHRLPLGVLEDHPGQAADARRVGVDGVVAGHGHGAAEGRRRGSAAPARRARAGASTCPRPRAPPAAAPRPRARRGRRRRGPGRPRRRR